jgi:hypothetical protein
MPQHRQVAEAKTRRARRSREDAAPPRTIAPAPTAPALWPRLIVLTVSIVAITIASSCLPPPGRPEPEADAPGVAELRHRAGRSEDLDWFAGAVGLHPWLPQGLTRSQLIDDKHRSHAAGDAFREAQAAGVLAAEAQVRAARVLDVWIGPTSAPTCILTSSSPPPCSARAPSPHWRGCSQRSERWRRPGSSPEMWTWRPAT